MRNLFWLIFLAALGWIWWSKRAAATAAASSHLGPTPAAAVDSYGIPEIMTYGDSSNPTGAIV